MTSTRLHVSTLWGSSSGLYKVLETFKNINETWPDGIPYGATYVNTMRRMYTTNKMLPKNDRYISISIYT
jgi:hypothetical protein